MYSPNLSGYRLRGARVELGSGKATATLTVRDMIGSIMNLELSGPDARSRDWVHCEAALAAFQLNGEFDWAKVDRLAVAFASDPHDTTNGTTGPAELYLDGLHFEHEVTPQRYDRYKSYEPPLVQFHLTETSL